jgi:hypothetical protein
MLIYYFGCWDSIGHHLYTPGGRYADDNIKNLLPCKWENLDGGFSPEETNTQGIAKLTHIEDWTIVSFWDYSVDTRHGSHSTFIIDEILDIDKALMAARNVYPGIFARYKFQISGTTQT